MKTFVRIVCVGCALVMLSSCAVKTGKYNFEHGFDGKLEEPLHYWDFEFSTPRWWCKDHVDSCFNVGYGDGSDSGTLETNMGDIPAESASLLEFRAGARWFPLGGDMSIVPYIGGGYGWFKYQMKTSSRGDYAYSDSFYDYYDIDEDTTTLSSCWFPFVSGGLYVPLREKDNRAHPRPAVQLEYRQDFDKANRGLDLSGYQVSAGLALMW